jgi:hypothetical protein
LRNKGNKLYQNTHGTVFRAKTNNKRRKKMELLKRQRKAKVQSSAEKPVVSNGLAKQKRV